MELRVHQVFLFMLQALSAKALALTTRCALNAASSLVKMVADYLGLFAAISSGVGAASCPGQAGGGKDLDDNSSYKDAHKVDKAPVDLSANGAATAAYYNNAGIHDQRWGLFLRTYCKVLQADL